MSDGWLPRIYAKTKQREQAVVLRRRKADCFNLLSLVSFPQYDASALHHRVGQDVPKYQK